MQKLCLDCNEPIRGRSDKKFCTDQCRNNYNNKLNSDNNNYVRNVNNILRRNKRILEELNPEDKVKILKSKLTEKGFNFNYFTNTYTTQKGSIYHFCYEQGYLFLENDQVMIVKRKEYVE